MWPLILAGAGLGAVRSMQQEQQAKQDRKREAEIARWSPWSGMQAQRVGTPDYMDNIMQGGLTGAMMGQAMKRGKTADPTSSDMAGEAGMAGDPNAVNYNGSNPNAMSPYYNPWKSMLG